MLLELAVALMIAPNNYTMMEQTTQTDKQIFKIELSEIKEHVIDRDFQLKVDEMMRQMFEDTNITTPLPVEDQVPDGSPSDSDPPGNS